MMQSRIAAESSTPFRSHQNQSKIITPQASRCQRYECKLNTKISESSPLIDRRSILLATTASILLSQQPSHALTAAEVTPTIQTSSAPTSERERLTIDAFARSDPSVVTIYDVTLPSRIPSGPGSIEQAEGNGSGFIYDATNGYVVTNYHCLAGSLGNGNLKLAPKAKVALVYIQRPDGVQQAFDGLLVGADKARDIAVLQVNAPPSMLRALPFADSSQVNVGQQVLAIGAPFGFSHTLTTGVISALNRGFSSQTGSVIVGMQTSAALNPGNSGGPLLDTSGRCIGMNTAIFTNTGTSVNIGFVIPSNTVKSVVSQLIERGAVLRASLGIEPATDPVAKALDIADGVLIQTVRADGAAQRAGLRGIERGFGGIVPGDCIVRVGKKAVHGIFDLSSILDEYSVGDVVEVEVVRRNGGSDERMVVNVELEEEKNTK